MTPRRKQFKRHHDSAHGKGVSRLKARGHKHLAEVGTMQVRCKRCGRIFHTYATEQPPRCTKSISQEFFIRLTAHP